MKEKLLYLLTVIRNLVFWFIPILLLIAIVFVVVSFLSFLDKSYYQNVIELLKILIWPATILVALYFFRKVFTYMFFSLDEFNFFGAKGSLKNIQDVINERINKINKNKEMNEKSQKRVAMMNDRMVKLMQSTATEKEQKMQWQKIAQEVFEKYDIISKDYAKLSSEKSSIEKPKLTSEELLAQIAALQNQLKTLREQLEHISEIKSEKD